MHIDCRRGHLAPVLLVLALVPAIAGCRAMSERVMREGAGLNGGFETVEGKLPVNWLLYTPDTVPEADFTVDVDGTRAFEGSRSLHFTVKHCLAEGGWHSPGCATEQPVTAGERYRVSLRVLNTGALCSLSAGAVSAFKGGMVTLALPADTQGQWVEVHTDVQVPKGRKTLRAELNVRSAGEVWFDQVRIERVDPE